MRGPLVISGFSDEICQPLEGQLAVVTRLGMDHICLRSAGGKGIAQYTPAEAREALVPLLHSAGVHVSALGTALGKIRVDDEESFAAQLEQLDVLCGLCKILDCRYLRIFSFYPPAGAAPDACRDMVLEKLRRFLAVAQRQDVVLLHENEKGIYGDTGARCRILCDALAGEHFAAAFDFANFVQCGEDPAACWDLLGPFVRDIHIKDALAATGENVLCGTGDGQIGPLLARAVRREQYRGFLTLEPHLTRFDFFAPGQAAAGQKVRFEGSRAANGAQGYERQYRALWDILQGIDAGA